MKDVYVGQPCDIIGGSLYNTKGHVVAFNSAKNEVKVRLDEFTHVTIDADYIEQKEIPFHLPELSQAESVELAYWQARGFNYLVRNEIGSVHVFVNFPHRDSENYPDKMRGGYDMWIETKTPISREESFRDQRLDMGRYEFLQWADAPIPIYKLLPAPLTVKAAREYKPRLD